MNALGRAVAGIVFLSCWYVPADAGAAIHRAASAEARQTTQVESVSGRITSVTGNTFTIELLSAGEHRRKSLTITIDQDTVLHGKIAVGLKADITFRRADQTNVAVSVRTSPA